MLLPRSRFFRLKSGRNRLRPCLKSLLRFRPQMDRLEDRTLPSVTVGVSVAGIDGAHSSCGCLPPDGAEAAGPLNTIQAVNTAMEITDKSGNVISGPTSLPSFFSGHGFTVSNQSDPVVLFDESVVNSSGPNGRFIIIILDYTSTSSPDNLDFAISTDADATHGFTNFRQVNVGEGSFFADQPRLGINADAYFVQFNMFSTVFGTYDHPQIMAIQKSSVLSGGFTTFHHDQSSSLFSIDPADMHGAVAGGPESFVTEGATAGQIAVITETNVLSNTPTDTTTNFTVASYSQPPAAPQPSGTVTTNDSRMLNAAWRDNILVSTHTVGTGSPTEAHARWYQFSTSGSTPTFTQSGEINPGSGVATYFPSIDIDTNDDLGMTYIESSSSEFVSMYVTGRTPSDPIGTMETGIRTRAGTTNYTGSRMGDYSGIGIDPSNTTTFWAENEFINNSGAGSWATGIASFTLATSNAATHFSVSAPSSSTAGSAFTITVTALTGSNAVATGYTGTVHFTSSDGQAVLPANYTFTATDAGVHTFTNGVTLKTAGSQAVTATDTVTSTITGSASVSVSPAAASQLVFGQQPTNTVANATISPAPTVKVEDAFGNLETGDNTDAVTMAIGTNPAGGTLSGTLTVTASGGVATFSNLSINNIGNGYTLVATSGSLTSATSNAFNITATVPTHFSVTGPSSSTAGAAFTITVTALDANNQVVTSYTGTVHFTSSDGQASLPSDYTFTSTDSGVHTFTNGVTLKTAGSQSVTATDTATSSITGSVSVSVSPAAASKLVFGQQPTNTRVGSTISPAPTVQVQDAFGNLETADNTDQVTMAIGTNPSGGSLSGTLTVTASGGVATFSTLSINKVGNGYTLVTTSGSLTSATSNAFNITKGGKPHVQGQGVAAAEKASYNLDDFFAGTTSKGTGSAVAQAAAKPPDSAGVDLFFSQQGIGSGQLVSHNGDLTVPEDHLFEILGTL
jgi:hypothetical protein